MQSTFILLNERRARSAYTWPRKWIQQKDTRTKLFDVQTYVIEMVNVLHFANGHCSDFDGYTLFSNLLRLYLFRFVFTQNFIDGWSLLLRTAFIFNFSFAFKFPSFGIKKISFILYDFSLPFCQATFFHRHSHLIHSVHLGYKNSKLHNKK